MNATQYLPGVTLECAELRQGSTRGLQQEMDALAHEHP